jgi:D-alanyl-D-alanine dipeptidase
MYQASHLWVRFKLHHRPNMLTVACYEPYGVRFFDNSIDMGTGFDCFDERAHTDSKNVGIWQHMNRHMLETLMNKHGFENYAGNFDMLTFLTTSR